ncbi:hypothetical protein [Campylobacter ureolyticus]|uniref:hypothetical protein n=1 Tax=Campylobacter ureolyticus TaxID=827 RepID=UPI001177AD97|nr:hypothetical protein [Campylobacter ureolyticus]MCR8685611.1 hypothetical protein [Campylobacter ureolyticus]QQY36383.1 hypothetical protein I6I59_03905 [Campylobacter ureolyticus]
MNIIDYDYQGFNNGGENKWIITSYEITREKDKTFSDAFFTDKLPLTNSSERYYAKNTDNLNMKRSHYFSISSLK